MRRGLTLIEIMVSSFLFMMVILALFALLSSTLRSIDQADINLGAETYAQEALDLHRNQALVDLKPGKGPLETSGIYQRQLEISDVAGFAPDQLKELVVVVTWQQRGIAREIRRSLSYGGCED